MNLQRKQGPSCPECGCQDSTPGPVSKGRKGWWHPPRRNRRCNHCGSRFVEIVEGEDTEPAEKPSNGHAADEEEPEGPRATVFHILCCPSCGGEHTRVTRTMRPVRYHKCKDCQHKFQSVEKKS